MQILGSAAPTPRGTREKTVDPARRQFTSTDSLGTSWLRLSTGGAQRDKALPRAPPKLTAPLHRARTASQPQQVRCCEAPKTIPSRTAIGRLHPSVLACLPACSLCTADAVCTTKGTASLPSSLPSSLPPFPLLPPLPLPLTRESKRPHVPEHEVVGGAVGNQTTATLHQRRGKGCSIALHLQDGMK